MNLIQYIGRKNSDGQPEGQGKAVFETGQYEGHWSCGQFHGRGVLSLNNGTHYDGEFKDHKMDGQGRLVFSDGRDYTGSMAQGTMNGRGVLRTGEGVYTGNFLQGERHGRGEMVYVDGSTYTGEWKHGKQTGKGTLVEASGVQFQGTFNNGTKNGVFHKTMKNQAVYRMVFLDGRETSSEKVKDGPGVLARIFGFKDTSTKQQPKPAKEARPGSADSSAKPNTAPSRLMPARATSSQSSPTLSPGPAPSTPQAGMRKKKSSKNLQTAQSHPVLPVTESAPKTVPAPARAQGPTPPSVESAPQQLQKKTKSLRDLLSDGEQLQRVTSPPQGAERGEPDIGARTKSPPTSASPRRSILKGGTPDILSARSSVFSAHSEGSFRDIPPEALGSFIGVPDNILSEGESDDGLRRHAPPAIDTTQNLVSPSGPLSSTMGNKKVSFSPKAYPADAKDRQSSEERETSAEVDLDELKGSIALMGPLPTSPDPSRKSSMSEDNHKSPATTTAEDDEFARRVEGALNRRKSAALLSPDAGVARHNSGGMDNSSFALGATMMSQGSSSTNPNPSFSTVPNESFLDQMAQSLKSPSSKPPPPPPPYGSSTPSPTWRGQAQPADVGNMSPQCIGSFVSQGSFASSPSASPSHGAQHSSVDGSSQPSPRLARSRSFLSESPSAAASPNMPPRRVTSDVRPRAGTMMSPTAASVASPTAGTPSPRGSERRPIVTDVTGKE